MTHSEIAPPKDALFANDNFQELRSDLHGQVGAHSAQFSPGFSLIDRVEPLPAEATRSSMVSGAAVVMQEQEKGASTHRARDRFANWTKKTKIGRRSITRQLTLRQVTDLKSAWHHARTIGQPVNRFITFRPRDINDQDPDQRIKTWWGWRNKLAQFARDNGFDFTCLWTRESKRETARDEHLHVLMHVPPQFQKRFDKVVRAWCNGSDEIDVRGSTYRTRRNEKGGEESVLTYIAKNSPQAGRYLNHTIQYGGPIFGRRYGLSTNLTARARSRDEVHGRLRRDLRLPSIQAGVPIAVPVAANEDAPTRDRHQAA